MRLIGGEWGGRDIRTGEGPGYRPAMAKVRKALFSMLDARGVSWPETAVLDFLDLPEPLRGALIDECVRVAAYIREESRFTRINFAAIGNLVPQLHLHVVGRHPGDPCWPQPVWGHLATDHSYSATEVATIRDCLIQRIGLTPNC